MRILVAGCGWLGSAVAAALAARGDIAIGVRRSAGEPALRRSGVETFAADLEDPRAMASLPADVDAIVACQAAGNGTAEAYERAYIRVTGNLLDCAARRRLRAFVYTGSTGVFGQRDGGTVDEATPPLPTSPTAAVLARAERLVLDAGGATGGVPACVLRLSGLYGPERYGLIERVRSGRLGLGAGDGRFMNFCHREDAVRAVLGALDAGRPGAAYHASDAAPTRQCDVVRWVAARLGIDPAIRAADEPPPPGGRNAANRRVLADSSRAELGLALAYPSFREGLAAGFESERS